MIEQAVSFGVENSLIGIVTAPCETPVDRARQGVILLNPGIVHRVGPGRIYVQIARALAERGFLVLRFDFSGIGDSGQRLDNLPFERSAVLETQEAMNFLAERRCIDRFILFGGCSGAAIALKTAGCDRRVCHAILANFPVGHDEDEDDDVMPEQANSSKAHYYWNYALFSTASWQKLLNGSADYRSIRNTLGLQARRWFHSIANPAPHDPGFVAELLQATASGVYLTFVCSEGDPALSNLREAGGREMKRLCARGTVGMETIPRSDHTFSSLHDQKKLLSALVNRVERVAVQLANQPHIPDQERIVQPASVA